MAILTIIGGGVVAYLIGLGIMKVLERRVPPQQKGNPDNEP
jgi:hypothetical protein